MADSEELIRRKYEHARRLDVDFNRRGIVLRGHYLLLKPREVTRQPSRFATLPTYAANIGNGSASLRLHFNISLAGLFLLHLKISIKRFLALLRCALLSNYAILVTVTLIVRITFGKCWRRSHSYCLALYHSSFLLKQLTKLVSLWDSSRGWKIYRYYYV